MFPRPGHRLAVLWLALAAMLVATFAPAAARYAAAVRGQETGLLCSASDVGAAPSRREPPASQVLEHCPWCALHADIAPPPGAGPSSRAAPARFVERPAAFVAAPRSAGAWAAAQPRAPPAAG